MRSPIIRLLILLSFFSRLASAASPLALTSGWNLLGNSAGSPIDVATAFGDAGKIISVWKWNKTENRWAFYSPSMGPTALATYATGRGYGVLTSIDPKEGFWVNASLAVSVPSSGASSMPLVESDLQQGWNLVSSADFMTPSQLNQGMRCSLSEANKTILTTWAWDASSARWKFFAPSLEAQGETALGDYITNKGYLPFTAALLPTEGYWLNIGTSLDRIANCAVAVSRLNDTGLTFNQCYEGGTDALVSCSSAGALALNDAQDGMVGRDSDASLNSDNDGKVGFRFSNAAGGCIQDQVTGLMWEPKTNDGGLRDWTKKYTNYSAAYDVHALYRTTTDASGFVDAVNATSLCGYSDWRLPTADELQSIVDYGVAYPGPSLDATWFTHAQSGTYWTATPKAGDPGYAWVLDFRFGALNQYGRTSSYFVRLVRAASPAYAVRYTVSADGQEVTDTETNLIWRRCAEGMTFSGGTCTGTPSTFTHEAALQRAAAQSRNTRIAWRLPNVKELSSIADRSHRNLSIDTAAFPGTPASVNSTQSLFWSASPSAGSPNNAWYVLFNDGQVGSFFRTGSSYVRLVRSVQ